MADKETMGMKLRRLVERSGLSYDVIAKKAGYSGRSSVQRYFSEDYDEEFLSLKVAQRLAAAFEGTEVSRQEVIGLTGLPEANARVVRYEGNNAVRLRRDVKVYGTALGASRDFGGKVIEQTTLNTGEVIDYFLRPGVLQGKDVYGLYVQGSSMAPRYESGDTVFVDEKRPARIGDDVVVYLVDEASGDPGDHPQAVLLKRLVRQSTTWIELEQFSPAETFRIDMARVWRVDRVIPWRELLS